MLSFDALTNNRLSADHATCTCEVLRQKIISTDRALEPREQSTQAHIIHAIRTSQSAVATSRKTRQHSCLQGFLHHADQTRKAIHRRMNVSTSDIRVSTKSENQLRRAANAASNDRTACMRCSQHRHLRRLGVSGSLGVLHTNSHSVHSWTRSCSIESFRASHSTIEKRRLCYGMSDLATTRYVHAQGSQPG